MTLVKARRGPFTWRLFKQEELVQHYDSRCQYGVFGRTGMEEGYAGSEHTAAWLADKWNTEAALLLLTEGTAAHQQIAQELYAT